MRLKDLGKYGIPELVLEAWRTRQGEYLLPLQEKAIRAGILNENKAADNHNLLIAAPTSSGKSFCGEIAAIGALMNRRKAVMLVPLKSIAEEKYNYYRHCYAGIGIRTIIATGDHPENDNAFEAGDFDLALAIYEKFNRLLTVNPGILRQIGLIVVDEMQMLADAERGSELEMALVKTFVSEYAPRIVALSAVLDDETELARWLGADVIREANRPVDLLLGIICNGYFKFRSFNSGFEGQEKIDITTGENLSESIIDLLKKDDSRKLIFLKSRRDTINAAFNLAGSVNWGEARATIDALDGEEPSFLMRALRQTLSRGVAFHNADLTQSQRAAIEQGYLSGEIKVIFTTTTLAMGVNLPAELVLLETMKYADGGASGRTALVPITASEFQNIAGRAGRFGLGHDNQAGRAAIMADSDFEYEVLWSGYIDAPRGERLESALGYRGLDDILLDFIAYGFNADKVSPESLLARTFFYHGGGSFEVSEIKAGLERLAKLGLIRTDYSPSPAGLVSAYSGISSQSYAHYRKLLDIRYPETLIGWLFLALSGSEINLAQIGLTRSEFHNRSSEKSLYQRYDSYINELGLYAGERFGREPFDFRTAAILKAVFLLSEWADEAEVELLEPRYQLHHGQIISLADTAGWLIGSLAKLIEAGDANSPVPALLDEYSFRVQFGIPPEMSEIYYLLRRILNRKDYKILAGEGIKSIRDLAAVSPEKLSEFIKPESKMTKLLQEINILKEEDAMQNQINPGTCPINLGRRDAVSFSSRFGVHPTSVELDGRFEGERYLVNIDGFPIRLTGKSFKYLAKLAYSRLANSEGWMYKDDIEVGFNQARYLYRLKQEVNRDGGCAWPIFENNRLGYYRLDLEPSKIHLNFDNLRNHPDYELREIAERLSPRQAG